MNQSPTAQAPTIQGRWRLPTSLSVQSSTSSIVQLFSLRQRNFFGFRIFFLLASVGVYLSCQRLCSRRWLENFSRLMQIMRQDLKKVIEVFMGQLWQLFGLKYKLLFVISSGAYVFLASHRGFTEWELDVLSWQYTCFNLLQCETTLGWLSRLMKFSLEAAKLAQSNASIGAYNASAVYSRQARSLAEEAFFHSSMMSVNYYSFEHCFAVYLPYFLRVSLHFLLAVAREWNRYKQERENT